MTLLKVGQLMCVQDLKDPAVGALQEYVSQQIELGDGTVIPAGWFTHTHHCASGTLQTIGI